MKRIFLLLALAFWIARTDAAETADPFAKVAAIFAEHCYDCHAVQDPEGHFVLETYDLLMKGGESGAAIVPGKSSESLLVRMIEGKVEKDGKSRIMPPGKRKKLSAEEIAVIREWVDAGAKAPAEGALIAKEIVVPKIEPKVPARRAINSVAFTAHGKILAVGRAGRVELYSAEEQTLLRTLSGPIGNVNALAFSADGKVLYAAGGDTGISGEIQIWNVADGTALRTISGHKDTIYSLALSPDGKTIATGSYDQKIKLWDAGSGAELRTISGHNGAIYSLAFRNDGKILASASGDRTVKLWDVATGERRETFSQPLKELYATAFAPDGKRLAGAGADNRVRIWEVSAEARETTNPLLHSKFAHEGAVLRLAFSSDGKLLMSSADDKTVKVWDAGELSEKLILPPQSDWPSAITFILENKGIFVGRLDGSMNFYDAANGTILPRPKPELARLEPRGVQRGLPAKVKLIGKRLESAKSVKLKEARIMAEILRETAPSAHELWISLSVPGDLSRGPQELAVETDSGETGWAKFYVDDLPQVVAKSGSASVHKLDTLPVAVWGAHESSGDSETFQFKAEPGQTLTFDGAAKALGSKSDLVLTLADESGRVLASSSGHANSADPLIAHTFASGGTFTVTAGELMLGASPEHFYRLAIGALPLVTAMHPTAIHRGEESDIELIGFNLPKETRIEVKGESGSEMPLALDESKFRALRPLKIAVLDRPHSLESEPNDDWQHATTLAPNSVVSGRLHSEPAGSDEDWYRFNAKAGETWILETAADQIGSPADTKIEVMDEAAKPVLRTLLQAVRDSAITFRGIDSTSSDCRVENWEEMELNQFLYLQGEAVKLLRAPQGPDSGFVFYNRNGRRLNFFDTSATTHAVNEPCYIVEAHPPGSKLPANGLPTFPIWFQNDDDAERKLGSDSKLYFTAPKDDAYFARVTDTRGFSGERFVYRLALREPKPDFNVSLSGGNPTIARGGGSSFTVSAERLDGFEGPIRIDITGVPPGFSIAGPLVIQAGHTSTSASIFADPAAAAPSDATVKLTASAEVHGSTVTKAPLDLGKINVTDSAQLYVSLVANSSAPDEITIAPGQTVSATIKIRRNGQAGNVGFNVENLPHGIIVDNIGLNGVVIVDGQSEREITFTAAKWVPETDCYCYAISNEAGRQTSKPLLVKVRGASGMTQASAQK